jgi:hypothetical protein
VIGFEHNGIICIISTGIQDIRITILVEIIHFERRGSKGRREP